MLTRPSLRDSISIYKVRKKDDIGKYLHPTTIRSHINFLCRSHIGFYKRVHFDFVIKSREGEFLGTISVYNIDWNKRVGEVGRWISIGNASQSIESLYLIFKFSFDLLELHEVFCMTLLSNSRTVSLHSRLPYTSRSLVVKDGDRFARDTLTVQSWCSFSDFLIQRLNWEKRD